MTQNKNTPKKNVPSILGDPFEFFEYVANDLAENSSNLSPEKRRELKAESKFYRQINEAKSKDEQTNVGSTKISIAQCGDLLATWVSKETSPDHAKNIAKNIGYNDSPLFGKKKKKVKLVCELAMINVAIVIVAVNQVVEVNRAKDIIDTFLSIANKSIFSVFERQNYQFKGTYEKRMAQYFELFGQENPGLGISFALLANLDLDPLKNMKGQIYLSKHLGSALSMTIQVLKNMEIR